ncbi:MAG: glycine--tRNA ligase subunit beta [Collinsella sp.]
MADAKDFLFEIGTEEMPSAPLNNAVKQLGTMIAKGLDEAGLAHGEVRVISTPRRLAALVADVATATDEVHEVKRGPAANIAFDADGNATKAAQGFARKCGVAAEDLVRREDTDGREYVFAEKNIPSAPATPILTALCEKTIAGLQWPNYRSQRWGHEHATFVRPVRWICCLWARILSSRVVCRRDERQHHARSSRAWPRDQRVVAQPRCLRAGARGRRCFLPSAVVRPSSPVSPRSRPLVPAAMSIRPRRSLRRSPTSREWPTVLVGTFDEEFLKVPHESSASPCSPTSATSRSMTARASSRVSSWSSPTASPRTPSA